MNFRRTSLRFLAVAALATAAFGVQTAMTAAPSAPSQVITIDPARILDTRLPLGVPTIAPVGPNSSITVQVTGVGGVPLNATGVIVTLTATNATLPTFITATPTGTPRSATSVLNPGVGAAIANTVTMSLGTGGKIDLYNLAGNVDLVADVSGYLVPQGATVVTESIELQAYSGQGLALGLPGNFGCVDLATSGELFLDVPLPHGAAVQSVVYRWYDTSAVANMTMVMFEVNGGFPGTPTMGGLVNSQGASTGSAGYGSTALTIAGGDAVSGTLRYMIDAFTLGTGGGGAQHMFCGATVTYARVV